MSISGRAQGVRLFFRVGGAHPIARLRSLVVPPQNLCSFSPPNPPSKGGLLGHFLCPVCCKAWKAGGSCTLADLRGVGVLQRSVEKKGSRHWSGPKHLDTGLGGGNLVRKGWPLWPLTLGFREP